MGRLGRAGDSKCPWKQPEFFEQGAGREEMDKKEE